MMFNKNVIIQKNKLQLVIRGGLRGGIGGFSQQTIKK